MLTKIRLFLSLNILSKQCHNYAFFIKNIDRIDRTANKKTQSKTKQHKVSHLHVIQVHRTCRLYIVFGIFDILMDFHSLKLQDNNRATFY